MKKLLAFAGALAILATPAYAGNQFFINIPSIIFGFGGGGGYDGYPPPPAYPPQYSPQAPIYGGYYYYKGDYPQPPPYAHPVYPGGVGGGVVIGGGGGYYDGYQGGYGYKKHRYKKKWKEVPPPGRYPELDELGGAPPPKKNYRPSAGLKPGCDKPPMCTGGKPWRPQ